MECFTKMQNGSIKKVEQVSLHQSAEEHFRFDWCVIAYEHNLFWHLLEIRQFQCFSSKDENSKLLPNILFQYFSVCFLLSFTAKVVLWRRLTFLIGFPAIGLGMLNAYLGHQEHVEQPRPEFVAYEHLRIRRKGFPWGDGTRSLFHNPVLKYVHKFVHLQCGLLLLIVWIDLLIIWILLPFFLVLCLMAMKLQIQMKENHATTIKLLARHIKQ